MYGNLVQIFITYALINSITVVYGGIMSPPVGCTTYLVESGICSGHGECRLGNSTQYTVITEGNVPGSQCVCVEGYSGINDWVNMDTHDCPIRLVGVQIIWSILLASLILELGMILWKLYQSYQTLQVYLSNREGSSLVPSKTHMTEPPGREGGGSRSAPDEENQNFIQTPTSRSPSRAGGGAGGGSGSGARSDRDRVAPTTILDETPLPHPSRWARNWEIFQLFWSWPVVKVCLLSLIGTIPLAIQCILRIRNPELAIGLFFYATFANVLMENMFICSTRVITFSWLDVRSKVLRFTDQNEAAAERAILRFRHSLYVTFVIDMTRAIFAFLIHPFPRYSSIWFLLYNLLLVLTQVVGGWSATKSGYTIVAILQDGLEMLKGTAKVEREQVAILLRTNLKATTQSIVGTCILAVLNSFWPFLRNRQGYVMIQAVVIGLLTTTYLRALNPPKVNSLKDQPKEEKTHSQASGGQQHSSKEPETVVSRDKEKEKERKQALVKERETAEELEQMLGVHGFKKKPDKQEEEKKQELEDTMSIELVAVNETTALPSPSLASPSLLSRENSTFPEDTAFSSSIDSSQTHTLTQSRSMSELTDSDIAKPIFNPFS